MNRHGRRLLRFTLPAMLASALGATSLASAQALFTPTGSLNTPRDSHTATRLSDGTVLAAGGTNSDGTVGSAEIYNPMTGAWDVVSGATLRTPRWLHSATLLQDGKVLFVGGLDQKVENMLDVRAAQKGILVDRDYCRRATEKQADRKEWEPTGAQFQSGELVLGCRAMGEVVLEMLATSP